MDVYWFHQQNAYLEVISARNMYALLSDPWRVSGSYPKEAQEKTAVFIFANWKLIPKLKYLWWLQVGPLKGNFWKIRRLGEWRTHDGDHVSDFTWRGREIQAGNLTLSLPWHAFCHITVWREVPPQWPVPCPWTFQSPYLWAKWTCALPWHSVLITLNGLEH